MRINLIHHPSAGDDDQPDAEALTRVLQRHGHTVRYQSADDDTWAAILDEPADLVVVAGGDGTVGRVARKLIGRDLPLAPLPLGTANNISRTLGLIGQPIDEIVQGWNTPERIAFDAGVAQGPWGSRYFIEGFGIGLFACTIPAAERSKTLENLDDAQAKVAYAVGMLRERLHRCPSHHLRITLDGRSLSDDYVLFEAMNMEFVGPNLHLAPDMRPNDGLLDVVLVTAAQRDALEEPLAKWQHGSLHRPDLTSYRAHKITLEWTGYEVHIDDEPWPAKDDDAQLQNAQIELEVLRNAVQFIGSG
ncbi:MAG TPA: diacylglycerol kinase family protein [Burkholderiales bacterium]|nr:diacylglycerol kinase family protein [Burkholderiales bacterium]